MVSITVSRAICTVCTKNANGLYKQTKIHYENKCYSSGAGEFEDPPMTRNGELHLTTPQLNK